MYYNDDYSTENVQSFTVLKPYKQPDITKQLYEQTNTWIKFDGAAILPLSDTSLRKYTKGGDLKGTWYQFLQHDDDKVDSYQRKYIGATLLVYMRRSEKSRILPNEILPITVQRMQEEEHVQAETHEIDHHDQHVLQKSNSNEFENEIEMQIVHKQEKIQIQNPNFVRKKILTIY